MMIAALWNFAALAGPALSVTTESWPPYNMMVDDKPGGIATEILTAALERAGLEATIRLLPWQRAYQMVLRQESDCIYSTVRLPGREEDFKWIGPLLHDEFVVLSMSDRNLAIHSLDDLKKYRTAAIPGTAIYAILSENGVHPLDTSYFDFTKLLTSGRVDYMVDSRLKGAYHAARDKIDLQETLAIQGVDLWLACNRTLPDTIEAALNHAIEQMASDGSINRLVDRFR